LQKEDRSFVIKKFDLTEEEFDRIMQAPRVEHDFYGTEQTNGWKEKLFKALMAIPVKLMSLSRRAIIKFK
jgi:hypothetical protein